MDYFKSSNKNMLMLTEKDIKKFTAAKGEKLDYLLIPKSLKGVLHKKYPEFWTALAPCLQVDSGKILYFEE